MRGIATGAGSGLEAIGSFLIRVLKNQELLDAESQR
jgi:hypothetical protein